MSELTPVEPAGAMQIHGDLQRFEHMLLEQLADAGLPVGRVSVSRPHLGRLCQS